MITKLQGQLMKKITLQSWIDGIGDDTQHRSRAPSQELIHHPVLHVRLHRIKCIKEHLRVNHNSTLLGLQASPNKRFGVIVRSSGVDE
jgi:hypothetical protein